MSTCSYSDNSTEIKTHTIGSKQEVPLTTSFYQGIYNQRLPRAANCLPACQPCFSHKFPHIVPLQCNVVIFMLPLSSHLCFSRQSSSTFSDIVAFFITTHMVFYLKVETTTSCLRGNVSWNSVLDSDQQMCSKSFSEVARQNHYHTQHHLSVQRSKIDIYWCYSKCILFLLKL